MQDNKMSGAKSEAMQLYSEYKSLNEKINKIQTPVIENNEKLQKELNDVQNLFSEIWEKNASDENVDMEKLKTLKGKLQDNDLSEDKKQSVMEDYRNEAQKFQKAKDKTMNNQKIQKKQNVLSEKIKTATIEENPDAEKIYSKLEKIEEKLKNIQNSQNK
ncbi:MAG: hypothetical protein ACQEQS_05885 [Thermodesulfobacteriota bacterium]